MSGEPMAGCTYVLPPDARAAVKINSYALWFYPDDQTHEFPFSIKIRDLSNWLPSTSNPRCYYRDAIPPCLFLSNILHDVPKGEASCFDPVMGHRPLCRFGLRPLPRLKLVVETKVSRRLQEERFQVASRFGRNSCQLLRWVYHHEKIDPVS
jgi:hypothetical protein